MFSDYGATDHMKQSPVYGDDMNSSRTAENNRQHQEATTNNNSIHDTSPLSVNNDT